MTSDPPSDPEGSARLDDTAARADLNRLVRELRDDVRQAAKDIKAMRDELAEARGAARTWRFFGGVAAAAALTLGGWAASLGSQASADHDRVSRNEAHIEAQDDDLDEMREDIAVIRTMLEQRHERIRPEE